MSAMSDKTEPYVATPPPLEPYVPSPAPAEPYTPTDDEAAPLARAQDAGTAPGEEDVVLLEPAEDQRPVGRVPGNRRQERQEGFQPRGVAPADGQRRSTGRGRARGMGVMSLASSIVEAERQQQRNRTASPALRRPSVGTHGGWQQSLSPTLRPTGRGRGRGRESTQVRCMGNLCYNFQSELVCNNS